MDNEKAKTYLKTGLIRLGELSISPTELDHVTEPLYKLANLLDIPEDPIRNRLLTIAANIENIHRLSSISTDDIIPAVFSLYNQLITLDDTSVQLCQGPIMAERISNGSIVFYYLAGEVRPIKKS